MRVLLAGATGVIGRQTVPVLTAAGYQMVGLARLIAQLCGCWPPPPGTTVLHHRF